MAEVTVKLSRRYDVGSSSFDALRFREPKLKDRRVVGPLYDIQRGVVLTNDEAIWAYAERLLIEVPTGAIGELELTDAEAVEDTIRGFFINARLRLSERTSSSSGLDGTPAG